jgi:hypothetical protein
LGEDETHPKTIFNTNTTALHIYSLAALLALSQTPIPPHNSEVIVTTFYFGFLSLALIFTALNKSRRHIASYCAEGP